MDVYLTWSGIAFDQPADQWAHISGSTTSDTPASSGSLPFFGKFDTATEFPPTHQIEPDNSGGDDCHRLVKGVDDETLGKIFETKQISDFSICDNGGYRTVTEAEIVAQKKAYMNQMKA
jgi:hypothetical protein